MVELHFFAVNRKQDLFVWDRDTFLKCKQVKFQIVQCLDFIKFSISNLQYFKVLKRAEPVGKIIWVINAVVRVHWTNTAQPTILE